MSDAGQHKTKDGALPVEPEAITFSRPKVKKDEADLDITPMIDITFLLLIFFLVASRLDSDSVRNLPDAKQGVSISATNTVILTVTADGPDGAAVVFLGDGPLADTQTSDGLDAQEAEIMDYVEREMASRPARSVLIKAEKTVRAGDVVRVMRAAASIEGAEVSKAYIGVKDGA
ncbi:biopolymer transporter ExbD [Blastopirellula sp. JC732]|uniref:Biopolymer transporter ExbD n=1 Tax=Blastopirellula sediminis TaxID=2894196 RepID=A0A9X1SJ35_9BACT|nr:biopolymer transporter ExbD [Blastopirellula sediminis]MCC9604438.1 biopolymer transporter ExbD [Blastopirellula sediminis]MCC9632263.1 biopolymer transporter ExbD [Blastopirellula sediminis]